MHLSVAYISNLVDLWAVIDWRFEIQWRDPFSHRIYPDTYRYLNRSRYSGGLDGSGYDVSRVPHLASVSAHSFSGEGGG